MPRRSKADKLMAVERILDEYPKVGSFLEFETPFQLLIAVILSAQCTDAMVNKVTVELFHHYPDPVSMARADVGHLEQLVHRTGFYRAKAKNIKACATELMEKHGGEVPKTMESLTALAGVGRKTANVILGQVFSRPAIIVDTHFGRVVQRLGLTKEKDPVKIEKAMAALVAAEDQYAFSMGANLHGRVLCHSRKPKCTECFLLDLCPTGKT